MGATAVSLSGAQSKLKEYTGRTKLKVWGCILCAHVVNLWPICHGACMSSCGWYVLALLFLLLAMPCAEA